MSRLVRDLTVTVAIGIVAGVTFVVFAFVGGYILNPNMNAKPLRDPRCALTTLTAAQCQQGFSDNGTNGDH